jgi:hypothetical protein
LQAPSVNISTLSVIACSFRLLSLLVSCCWA